MVGSARFPSSRIRQILGGKMLGDKIDEEIFYEKEKKLEAKFIKTVELASTIINKLKIKKKPLYVVGFNPKKHIYRCSRVKNLNEAYELIKKDKLTSYILTDYIMQKFNIGE